MTITDQPSVDNGVNVQALLDARAALTDAPEAAAVRVAGQLRVAERHAQPRDDVEGFFGLGEEQSHRQTFVFDADHPELFASEDHGATPVEYVLVGLAGCLTAGVAAVAQQPRHPAALGHGHRRPARWTSRASSASTATSATASAASRSRYEIDADASPERHRGDRRPVAEALGGLRHRHQPDERHRRGRLTDRVEEDAHGATRSRRRHRRRPRRPRDEPLPRGDRSIDHVVLERGEVGHLLALASGGTRSACSPRTG